MFLLVAFGERIATNSYQNFFYPQHMGVKGRRVAHPLPAAQLMGHHAVNDLRGANISRQLKLRFPLLE